MLNFIFPKCFKSLEVIIEWTFQTQDCFVATPFHKIEIFVDVLWLVLNNKNNNVQSDIFGTVKTFSFSIG